MPCLLVTTATTETTRELPQHLEHAFGKVNLRRDFSREQNVGRIELTKAGRAGGAGKTNQGCQQQLQGTCSTYAFYFIQMRDDFDKSREEQSYR